MRSYCTACALPRAESYLGQMLRGNCARFQTRCRRSGDILSPNKWGTRGGEKMGRWRCIGQSDVKRWVGEGEGWVLGDCESITVQRFSGKGGARWEGRSYVMSLDAYKQTRPKRLRSASAIGALRWLPVLCLSLWYPVVLCVSGTWISTRSEFLFEEIDLLLRSDFEGLASLSSIKLNKREYWFVIIRLFIYSSNLYFLLLKIFNVKRFRKFAKLFED